MYAKPEGDLSHAQRLLIGLIERRGFTGTLAREWEAPRSMIMIVYETALGRALPSYGVVFGLRRHIDPAAWYYGEDEELPPPVPCAWLYPSFGKKARKKVLRDATAALSRMEEIKGKRELSAFCAAHGVKYADLWACTIKRKKKDGRYGYHQRPPYRVIRALRETVHPALWFLYPDELSD
jgi:hypothetical protein